MVVSAGVTPAQVNEKVRYFPSLSWVLLLLAVLILCFIVVVTCYDCWEYE